MPDRFDDAIAKLKQNNLFFDTLIKLLMDRVPEDIMTGAIKDAYSQSGIPYGNS
jgi:hypothetical protein